MPATVTSITPKRSAEPPPRRTSARRPFRDNPRLILAGIAALVAILIAILAIANRTPRLAPDFLSEVVLYALSAADLTMLAALVFVLARNIIKLIVERRRALPFARFRAKLVALLLGMTLVPALLVARRSELIRERRSMVQRADGRGPVVGEQDRRDYYQERQALVSDHASRLAARCRRSIWRPPTCGRFAILSRLTSCFSA
jgi:two-component system nitrogen regulation sensor histidine kinase NtrY